MADPTKRTGSLEIVKDAAGAHMTWPGGRPRYCGRVRWPDGSRPRRHVPEKYCYSEGRAREYLRAVQEQIDAKGESLLVAPPKANDGTPATDADAWVKAWLASKAARGQTSTGDRVGHWTHHIKPGVGGKHVKDWTSEDLRALVASLDGKVAAEELSAKTARNVFGTATKMAGDACRSKTEALRVRDDNPAKDVEGPDRGEEKSKQFLYPSEFLALVSCEAVPLRWRRAIALAVFLYPRAGELRALRWEDVDLEHGTVHVHAAFERRSREMKSTKTKTARRVLLAPAIVPVLEAMRAEANGEGLVCPLPNRMADRLRGWLESAGVRRRELHDTTSRTTKPLGWHDLRATGLTWLAVRGEQPLAIMQRAGHADFATTQIYIRTAEAVREGFGVVFPPLPPALSGPDSGPEPQKPRENRSGTRDSNPRRLLGFVGFEPDSRHEPATADGRTDAASTPKATGTREPVQQAAQLEAAIERVTRALATADDDTIAELVAERRAMREELRALREVSAGVVHIATRRTSG